MNILRRLESKRSEYSVLLFRGVWALYFLQVLLGMRTKGMALAALAMSTLAWGMDSSRRTFFERALTFAPSSPVVRFGKTTSTFLMAMTAVLSVYATYLYFYGMNAGYFDWGIYLQGTSNFASTGKAIITGWDHRFDAEDMHYSLSISVLAFLYRLFPSSYLLVIWHAFFLIAPAFVFVLGLRERMKKVIGESDPWMELLLFWAFAFGPILSGNYQWPYIWHVIGPFFFALAFYFYEKNRVVPCFGSLVLFALQKQEFAIFVAAFGVFALFDHGRSWRRVALGVLSVGFGAVFYHFVSQGKALTFVDRFGNLGASPMEAALNLFRDPRRYWENWISWPSIRFFSFFFFFSFAFYRPKWRTLKYLFAVAPLLVLFCSESVIRMRELRNHYALPLNIALFAGIAFGFLPEIVREKKQIYRGRLALLFLLGVGALWSQNTPFHEVQRTVRLWRQKAGDRAWVETLRRQKDEAICCEGPLCALLTDRPVIVMSEYCLAGSKVLAFAKPKRVGLLVFKHSANRTISPSSAEEIWFVPMPERWDYESELIRFAWVEPARKVP